MAPSVFLSPTIPITGAIKTSQIPWGLFVTALYVPDIIFPALSVSYVPAGIIHVKIAIKIIIKNKIVNAEGI